MPSAVRRAAKQERQITAVAAYIRVSTDEQKRSGLGMEDQRKKCRAMCEVKGWPEPDLFEDPGISATKEAHRRPALAELLEALYTGKYQAVIVSSLDRLGRKLRLTIDLVDQIGQYADLVSCKESIDTTTAQGKFMLHVFAALAQLERDLISERTIAALDVLEEQTGETAGRVPYGYIRSENGILIVEQQARVVRLIFSDHRQKDSLRTIAERLNQAHIPGPRGGIWHHTSVREILRNQESYEGGYRGNSLFRWPPILRPSRKPLAEAL